MKPVATMTKAQIIKEIEKNSAKQSELNNKLIADGYGMVRSSELFTMGIPEAIEKHALCDRYCDLVAEKDRIYLGYRKSTPKVYA
jgi:hypothetical protein